MELLNELTKSFSEEKNEPNINMTVGMPSSPYASIFEMMAFTSEHYILVFLVCLVVVHH